MHNYRRAIAAIAASLVTFGLAAPAFGQFRATINVSCNRGESLAAVIGYALPNTLINVKGTCAGPITIATPGIEINSVNGGGINGNGKDAVTIAGTRGVVLSGLAISGGANGVVAAGGAQVTLLNDAISGNSQSGIVAETNSSVTVNGGSSKSNGFHGIDAESTSALVVSGTYGVSSNGVFGINVNNGSSLTLTGAKLTLNNNTLGLQMGTNASGFLDGQSSLTSQFNVSDGITLVSGSHMVDFGGTIYTYQNGVHGISLNSKAGLDLDAGSQVTAFENHQDGIHLEQSSVMTVFNNPQFSQVQTATNLTIELNESVGLNVLTGSRVLVDNYAAINVQGNQAAGILLDDGSSLSFGQTIPVTGVTSMVQLNGPPNIGLTFGSHLTYIGNDSLEDYACDSSSQVRGPNARTCQ